MSESIESLEKLKENNSDKLTQLEEWIATQTHIPKNISRNVLVRFLEVRDFNLEETKSLIDDNVKFRNKRNYLFSKRDVDSEKFQKVISAFHYARFSKLSKEGYAIESLRTCSENVNDYSVRGAVKLILMYHDIDAFIGPNNNGIVQIYDGSNFSYQHFLKFVSNIKSVIHLIQYGTSSACFRPRQIHLVFCPEYVTKIISMLKPFFTKEITDNLHCHSSNLESLHMLIDKDCLPIEYGGTNGTFKDHMDDTQKKFQENRDYLKNDENFFIVTK